MKPDAAAVADELRDGENRDGLADAEERYKDRKQNCSPAESGDARERRREQCNQRESEPLEEDVRHGRTLAADVDAA